MGFWDWLKNCLFSPLKRNISNLDGLSDADIDAVSETVDLSGRPLKEHHLRRALRDPRLLPKKKTLLRFTSRKKIMTFSAASRLFGGTMRTRNRNIRDLLPDEEQLHRFGLPIWRNEEDLAQALGISLQELHFFSIHREKDRITHYVTFSIPKRNGNPRLIMAPKRRLKNIQRALLKLLVEILPVSGCSHGFIKKRSIRTGAEPHVGKKVLIHFDIMDFFPSINFQRVRGFLISLGYGFPVATTLAVIMTEAERQPVKTDEGVFYVPVGPRHCIQGAPTSPGLCNALFLKVDRRLDKLGQKFGFCYSRYADDLTFSGDDLSAIQPLRAIVTRLLHQEGFRIHPEKTRVMRSGSRQSVTGVIVNKDLGLSRRERRKIRAMAHRLTQADPEGKRDSRRMAELQGKLAYLSMLNPGQAKKLGYSKISEQPKHSQ